MERRLFAAVVLFLLVGSGARAQSRGAVDWIFLVDTSASMRGVGGTQDIFDEVKASLRSFVTEAQDGDSVALFTFDRDAGLRSVTTVDDDRKRRDLYSIVGGLEANGNRTHLGRAIQRGLERAREAGSSAERTCAIVLFTDGKEDVRGIPNPTPILDNVRQVGDTHVFFVSMGDHEPQLDEFARLTPHSDVLRTPSRESIRQVAYEIRKRLPPPLRIDLSPRVIELGAVLLGESSDERPLTITANRTARVKLTISAPEGVTVHAVEAVDVHPGRPTVVKLHVTVADDAVPGTKQLTIDAPGETATATLDVVEPPLAMRIARIAIPIAILIAIGIVLLANYRRKNRLEGELEILEPRLAADVAYVGLPQLQTSEVALSEIVPVDALGGRDARLFVRRRSGQKKVWIASQGGSLLVNDIETPLAELFDADTIRIGDAKLRFNRSGHERAAETGEES